MNTTRGRVPFTLRGLGGGLAGSLALQGAAVLVEVAIGRRLGASGLGTYAVAANLPGLFSATITFGIAAAVGAAIAEADERRDPRHSQAVFLSGLVAAVSIGVLGAFALSVAAVPIATLLLSDAGASDAIRIFAATMPLNAIGAVAGTAAVALRHVRAEASYRMVDAVVRVTSIPALLAGAGVRDIALIALLAQGIAIPFVLVPILRSWPASTWRAPRASGGRSYAGFAFWQVIATSVWLVPRRLDTIVVAAVLGTTAAGVYRACLLLGSTVGLVLSALQSVFLSVAARRLASGGPAALFDHYRRVTRTALALSAPIAAFWCVAGSAALSVLGAPFVAGVDALVVIAIGHLVLVAGGHSTSALLLLRGPAAALNTAASAIAQLTVLPILAAFAGLTGAAGAVALGYVVLHALQVRGLALLPGVHRVVDRPLLSAWLGGMGVVTIAMLAGRVLPVIPALVVLCLALVPYTAVVVRVVLPAGERKLLREIITPGARDVRASSPPVAP